MCQQATDFTTYIWHECSFKMFSFFFIYVQYTMKTNALKKQNEEFQNSFQKVSIVNVIFMIR